MTALRPAERLLLLLLALCTALAGVANYQRWSVLPRFALATFALAGMAWAVSFATEQLGQRFGAAVTGLLQATLANLPELFVVIFALQKGQLVVARTAIVGSILANALLVLGLVIVVGARRAHDGVMRFSKRLPRDTATLLQVTVFIIVLLGLSLGSHDPASHHVKAISAVGAVCLLVVYLALMRPAPGPAAGRARRRAVSARSGAAPRARSPSDLPSPCRGKGRGWRWSTPWRCCWRREPPRRSCPSGSWPRWAPRSTGSRSHRRSRAS